MGFCKPCEALGKIVGGEGREPYLVLPLKEKGEGC